MKTIGMIFGMVLAFSPTAALAQTDAPPADPGLVQAPVGHRQPRPAAPAAAQTQKQTRDSIGVADPDGPAKLDERLRRSNDAAIRSICADCLKPLPTEKQQP